MSSYKENSYILYWKASFNELLSEALIKKWSRFDTATKFISLITISGSAFAGWFLWTTVEGKYIWSLIAVVVSIVSAANTTMKVPDRIKEWEERRGESSKLARSIESFRRLLNISNDDHQIKTEYTNLENKWTYGATLFKNTDILITDKLSNEVKKQVNQNIEEGRYNK